MRPMSAVYVIIFAFIIVLMSCEYYGCLIANIFYQAVDYVLFRGVIVTLLDRNVGAVAINELSP